ncbi:YbjN domain-containing protein [Corynebacterium mendelii]|uniref:YbjN domain-containing protein n=1 Tax=Corynebacterium mendelii TaxID=2765362 RepID=A0A939DZ74_9CORY|nr:YbjN domain-containing protein [Corynebacterium mendelii]MBN9643959.1 YbjN domain-containing protein [Corynebacterium mendelii]
MSQPDITVERIDTLLTSRGVETLNKDNEVCLFGLPDIAVEVTVNNGILRFAGLWNRQIPDGGSFEKAARKINEFNGSHLAPKIVASAKLKGIILEHAHPAATGATDEQLAALTQVIIQTFDGARSELDSLFDGLVVERSREDNDK